MGYTGWQRSESTYSSQPGSDSIPIDPLLDQRFGDLGIYNLEGDLEGQQSSFEQNLQTAIENTQLPPRTADATSWHGEQYNPGYGRPQPGSIATVVIGDYDSTQYFRLNTEELEQEREVVGQRGIIPGRQTNPGPIAPRHQDGCHHGIPGHRPPTTDPSRSLTQPGLLQVCIHDPHADRPGSGSARSTSLGKAHKCSIKDCKRVYRRPSELKLVSNNQCLRLLADRLQSPHRA